MSLQIQHVTKQYDQQLAVDNISFNVQQGEIVGFLGPNGAGKSTTMKMATCFLPQTSENIIVAGYNVMDKTMVKKKLTGFFPEHPLFYLVLYIHKYLCFIVGLYGLRSTALNGRALV